MKPRLALRILAVLVASTFLTSTAHAGYAADKFKQTLNHKYCAIDTSTFDGTAFKVPYPKAKQYYDNFVSQLNRAVDHYNRMSSRDRSGVRDMVPEMNKKIKWAKSMKPQLNAMSVKYANAQNAAAKAAREAKAAKQAKKDAKRKACNTFREQVYNTYKPGKWHFSALTRQLEEGKEYVETLERYNDYKAAAEHLEKGCARPDLKDLLASNESCWRRGPAEEPVSLCKIPAQKAKLLRLFVDNQGKRQMQNIINLWNIKRFKKLGPPFSFGNTYAYVTTVTDKDKQEVLKRIEPLYTGLKMSLPDLSDTWKELAVKKGEVKGLIDEQAKKPHGVKKQKLGYWKKSITKQIKAKYGSGAKLLRGSNGKWEIKLRFNAPLDRKMYGYVLWKAPGSPYCHASMYRVIEKYDGRRFQKAGGATMMGMSFHKCK